MEHTPDGDEETRRPRELLRLEQCLDMSNCVVRARTQHASPLPIPSFHISNHLGLGTLEVIDGQAAFFTVECGYTLDDGDRFRVFAEPDEEPGRLFEVEKEEAETPEEEGKPAEGEEEVAVAHVLRFRACGRALGAGKVGDERPRDL